MNSKAVIISPAQFDAVIFDLDGVVTRTAHVHAASWKRLFDEFLRARAEREGTDFRPFDAREEYLRYVDGKPRYDGVQSFLESRGIHLASGSRAHRRTLRARKRCAGSAIGRTLFSAPNSRHTAWSLTRRRSVSSTNCRRAGSRRRSFPRAKIARRCSMRRERRSFSRSRWMAWNRRGSASRASRRRIFFSKPPAASESSRRGRWWWRTRSPACRRGGRADLAACSA